MINFGKVKPGRTLYIPFDTYSSDDPQASMTITGLAVTDIEIYKDGSVTQRASDSGYTLLDTDGIDIDGVTGVHGVSVDLSDNTTAGFYAAGSQYRVVITSVTLDTAVISFTAATFEIGYDGSLLDTTIAVFTSTDNFTLAAGSADDDAYNGWGLIAHDVASAIQVQFGVIEDYTGSSKTVNLKADPGVFTMTAADNISIVPPSLLPIVMGTTLGVETDGDLTKVNTLDGHTAQTGDNYARLGAPDGASVSADIATADAAIDVAVADLANGTDGLGALKVLIDAVNTDLSNGTDGLGALKTLIDTVNSDLSNGTDGLGALLAACATITGHATEAKQDIAQTDLDTLTDDDVPALIAAIMTTQMTEDYATDGAAPTPAQSLMLIQQVLTDFVISGTTLTVRQVDGSTTALTLTLDDATNPTAATRAT